MSVQLQVARLEALLATIRTNAADLVRVRRGGSISQRPPAASASDSPARSSLSPARLSAPPVNVGDDDLELVTSEGSLRPSRPSSVAPSHPTEEVTGERPAVAFGAYGPGSGGLSSASLSGGQSSARSPSRTPPPESGPQITLPQEFEPLTSGALSSPNAPTLEQLGATVDLGGSLQPIELHVEEVPRRPTLPPIVDDLEASLPSRRFHGTYDASLAPPPSARAELEAHDRAERDRAGRRSGIPAAPELVQRPPSAAPPPGGPSVPTTPNVWERPSVPTAQSAAVFHAPPRSSAEVTFLELLDACLKG